MICKYCGTDHPGRASVCTHCGRPLAAPSHSGQAKRRKKNSDVGALVTVGIFMLLSAVLILLTFY